MEESIYIYIYIARSATFPSKIIKDKTILIENYFSVAKFVSMRGLVKFYPTHNAKQAFSFVSIHKSVNGYVIINAAI